MAYFKRDWDKLEETMEKHPERFIIIDHTVSLKDGIPEDDPRLMQMKRWIAAMVEVEKMSIKEEAEKNEHRCRDTD